MEPAVIVALVVLVGIPLLILIVFMLWSFFIELRLGKKWERESREDFERLWSECMTKKKR